MANDLQGKTALVTGGGRGIGASIAARLAGAGALVAVNYAVDAKAATETVAKITAAGGQAFSVQAQLGTPGATETLVAALDAEFKRRTGDGGLDILVNNIGVGGPGSIETATPEAYDWMMNTNVRVPFFLTQALIPRLREGGRVINISSAVSRIAPADFAPYSMSKAALEMFTVLLAKHLGPRGIAVNSVAPGHTQTRSSEGVVDEKVFAEMTLFKRIGQPADIADFVHALASPAGRWITGQCIEASGGMRF